MFKMKETDPNVIHDLCLRGVVSLKVGKLHFNFKKIRDFPYIVFPSGVYKWSVNPFTNPYPVYRHTTRDSI
jgi:hypothetical protein